MAQQTLDNNVLLSEQRAKINNNALDALSQSDTTTQNLASDVDFAAGKGVSFDGGVPYIPDKGETTVTASPEGTGSITLAADDLSYNEWAGNVDVRGVISIASTASPLGDYIIISPMPFSTGSLSSARSSAKVDWFDSSASEWIPVKAAVILSSSNELRIHLDATAIATSDQFYIHLNFEKA